MTQNGRRCGKAAIWALVAVAGIAAGVGGAIAIAQDAPPTALADVALDGERRALSSLELRYAREHARHPAVEQVLQGTVVVGRLADGYTAPREGVESVRVRFDELGALGGIYDSAIPVLSAAVAERLRELGLPTAYVAPDPAQLHLEDGLVIDTRAGSTGLTYLITTGKVTQVRTQALGERVDPDSTLVTASLPLCMRSSQPTILNSASLNCLSLPIHAWMAVDLPHLYGAIGSRVITPSQPAATYSRSMR